GGVFRNSESDAMWPAHKYLRGMHTDDHNWRTEWIRTEVVANQLYFPLRQRRRGHNFVNARFRRHLFSCRLDACSRHIHSFSGSKDAEAKLLPKHTARLPRHRRRYPSHRAIFPTDARERVW